MPLRLWCFTIVAVFSLRPSAAAPLVVPAPVTPAVAALAARVGMDPERDRSRFVPEIIRRIYSPPPSRQPPLLLAPRDPAFSSEATLVDVPLSPEIWSAAIFRRSVAREQLLATILADRQAALLCRGLVGADDDTLDFYAGHPALLSYLYQRAAPAFAAFAGSLRVHDGRLDLPGGPEAVPLWEGAAGARVDEPETFVRALFLEPESRTAYLIDVLDAARPDARAFALGLWIDDLPLRAERFGALLAAVRTQYREWHVSEMPFARPLNDLAMLLLRLHVESGGAPAPPAERRLWAAALDASPALMPPTPAAGAHLRVDAAWLLDAVAGDMYARGDKLDQLAFGQRVFAARQESDVPADAVTAIIRELPSRRMLLLSLDRLGVTRPEVYGAALHQARLALAGGVDRFWTTAQLQGALAIVVRMRISGTLSAGDVEPVLASLFAVPLSAGDFRGALAEWFEGSLGPMLPAGPTWQARVIAAVAGGPTPGQPEIEWEGQSYRLDLARAERLRIAEIRRRQGGPDLDVAFALARAGHDGARAASTDAVTPLADTLQGLRAASGALLARSPLTTMPPGVPLPRDGQEWLARATDEMTRAAAAGDLRRAVRAGESLLALSDVTLGHALISLVYAMHLGDPEGPALLGANVALRHDFGFGRRDGESRTRGAWAQPRQDFQPGVPWHVVGSLVGLDVALAPLGLHRLSMDSLAAPPRLPSIEREAFAMNVALLEPRRLSDGDRDRLVARLERGRARVRALRTAGPEALRSLTLELGVDPWRLRSIEWTLRNEPDSIENQFALAEFVVLGGAEAPPDAWGASGMLTFGCVCTRFPEPRTWRIVKGRSQLAMLAATNVELQIEVTRRLAALRLPAALLPSLLATGMQDFVDTVATADPSDDAALLDYPRRLSRAVVDDYVAAAATLDGPLFSLDSDAASTP